MRLRSMRRAAVFAATAIVLLGACGDDDEPAATDGGSVDAPDAANDAPDNRPAYDPSLPDLDDPVGCDVTFSDEGDVRAIAMGKKLLVSDVETIASYRDAMHRFFRVHAAGCLSEERPNVIVWPEDIAIHAVLAGTRGAQARQAGLSFNAFLALAGPLNDGVLFYANRFDLDPVAQFAQAALLATSDVAWRAFGDTFSAMAERYGVTMVVTTNLPKLTASDDPAAIAALADPDFRTPESVWLADDASVYNTTYAFGPDGELAGTVGKVYLTPPEEDTLLMHWADLAQMVPLEIEGHRYGVVISKDAWMPDVLGRLDDLGTEVMLQPEAFSGWAVPPPEEWQPDIVLEGAWNHTQRLGSVRYNVLPCMTGNFYENTFDGQSAVFRDARTDDALSGFIGQTPRPGFETVGPWAIDDPGLADPELTLEERRALLLAHGMAMQPGSGAPEENGYIESVVGADLELEGRVRDPGDTAATSFSPSLPLTTAPTSNGTRERNAEVCLAGDDSVVHVVFEHGPVGSREIAIITGDPASADPFAGDSEAVAMTGGDLMQPAIACGSSGPIIAAVRRQNGTERIVLQPADGPTSDLGGQELFRIVSRPTFAVDALDPDRVALVFHADDGEAARAYLARSNDGGSTFGEAERLDSSALDGRGPRVNQWSPCVAWRSEVLAISFVDFRAYSWDGYVMISTDGGETFPSEPTRVTPVPDGRERLYDEVHVALGPDGSALVAYGGIRERRADADVAIATLDLDGLSLGTEMTLSSTDDETTYSEWAVDVATDRDSGDALLVWQDMSSGRPGVVYAQRAADGTLTAPERADDGTASWTHAVEPRVLWAQSRAIVLWEDSREGITRLRYATRELGR